MSGRSWVVCGATTLALLWSSLVLTGCGGGGGADPAAPPPTVNPSDTAPTVPTPPASEASSPSSAVVLKEQRGTIVNVALSLTSLKSRTDGSTVASGQYDYGDGTTGTATSHTYQAIGTYVATVVGTDSLGQPITVQYTVTVNSDKVFPPTLATDGAAFTGWPVAFGAMVGDLAGLAVAGGQWDYGDGTTGTTGIHSYARPGTYTVTFTGTDTRGRTGQATLGVTVTTQPASPFQLALTVGEEPLANWPVSLTAATAETDGSKLVRGVWYYGDGQAGTQAGHTYAKAGTYTATFKGIDTQGRRATAKATVEVSACTPEGLAAAAATTRPTVCVLTTLGEMVFELDSVNAPISTANFLRYVDEQLYTMTLFHRVVDTTIHLVQGGGYTSGMVPVTGLHAPIVNESANGLKNLQYTLGMARLDDPKFDSATSQFYINTQDNPIFDHVDASQPGYAVFGRVIYGQDVADQLGKLPTNPNTAMPLSGQGIYGMALIHP